MKTAVIALTQNGSQLALKIQNVLTCDVYLKYPPSDECQVKIFSGKLKDLIADIYADYQAFILIMATGIAFRTFAPYVESKYQDPALVVMDEKGQFAIALLSGHVGGANDLARELSKKLLATPVITTATDVNQKIAFDMVAKNNNLYLENPSAVKYISSALVNKEKVALYTPYPTATPTPYYITNFNFAPQNCVVVISNKSEDIEAAHTLFLRPRNLVLGIGCRRGTALSDLENALRSFMQQQGFCLSSVRALASIDLKADEEGLLALSKKLALPLLTYPAPVLHKYTSPTTASDFVAQTTGTGSVAQAAALAATNAGKTVVEKTIVNGITFSLAEDKTIIEL